MRRREAVVIGGGQAGLATSRCLTDMRAGVLQLARWGVLDRIEREGTPRVGRTVFHYEDEVVDVPIKPRDGVPALFAPRRAAYFKDPITAHGISDALRDAELLARAVGEGGPEALAGYESARDGLSSPLFELTDRIASLEWENAELKALHRELSDEMKREVAAMVSLHDGREERARQTA